MQRKSVENIFIRVLWGLRLETIDKKKDEMTLYHLSYDAMDASDSEKLRMEIPDALLRAESSITELTEPARSTFRFEADSGTDVRGRILTAMSTFAGRCYYFVSGSDSYVQDNKVYYPSRTVQNDELNTNFQTRFKAYRDSIDSVEEKD